MKKMGEIAAFVVLCHFLCLLLVLVAVLVAVAVAGHCLLQHHYYIFQPILFYLIFTNKTLNIQFFFKEHFFNPHFIF